MLLSLLLVVTTASAHAQESVKNNHPRTAKDLMEVADFLTNPSLADSIVNISDSLDVKLYFKKFNLWISVPKETYLQMLNYSIKTAESKLYYLSQRVNDQQQRFQGQHVVPQSQPVYLPVERQKQKPVFQKNNNW